MQMGHQDKCVREHRPSCCQSSRIILFVSSLARIFARRFGVGLSVHGDCFHRSRANGIQAN
jgi:hypothetical protein